MGRSSLTMFMPAGMEGWFVRAGGRAGGHRIEPEPMRANPSAGFIRIFQSSWGGSRTSTSFEVFRDVIEWHVKER